MADLRLPYSQDWRHGPRSWCDNSWLPGHGDSEDAANRASFEMNDTTWQRLFGFRHAFDHPVTVVVTVTAIVLLILAPLLIFITTRALKSTSEKRKELWDRYMSE